MTPQEIFTRVKAHLLKQGVRSMDGRRCGYRGQDGTSCAVGCLIPDSLYHAELEGYAASSLEVGGVLQRAGVLDPGCSYWDLLSALQKCHDHHAPQDWRLELNSIAERFGLEDK